MLVEPANAKILSIDTSKAEALPDVRAVVTATDLPLREDAAVVLGSGPPVNLSHVSSNILAREKVLYRGHPIAAVAAASPHAAEEALGLIEVEYEVLPAVTDVESAMKSGTVDGVSFDIGRGEIVGLVGESGCGKTATSLALLGLLPRPAGRVAHGAIHFDGQDLTRLPTAALRWS